MLSPHNGATVYTGAEVLLRSLDRGDHWEEISPDLTTDDESKQHGAGNITFCTITTASESPLKPGVIWVGTDDGKVQLTQNHGATWTDCTARIAAAGGPAELWVSRVFASPHDAATAFVAKTGFRQDILKPFLFQTTDFGASWTSIAGDLPAKNIYVVLQDCKSARLLFAGTDSGLYVSFNRGQNWLPFKAGMPWAKVTDLVIHPRENDLIAATYGRGLWVTDITLLQEWNEKVPTEDVYLFGIEPRAQLQPTVYGNYQLQGDSHLLTPNESDDFVIRYYLKDKAKDKVKVTITDLPGKVLRELEGGGEAGFNTVMWDLRPAREKGRGAGEEYRAWRRPPLVEPGEYMVTLEAAGRKLTQKAVVRRRLGWLIGPLPAVIK
jgi:hypothetical protein